MNYCKIDNSLISKIFDNSSTKINKQTPGLSLIDIVDSKEFKTFKSDYCVMFAWNHKKEILMKEKEYSLKKGKWIIPLSNMKLFNLMKNKMKKVYYGKAVYGNNEIKAVLDVLKNKALSLMDGNKVKLLEAKVAKIFGKKYGLMVNSGSSANLLGLAIFKFKKRK